MRILVVSAHFPPNFVSGGTLVPFRSALELARRGHDVKVYAGWIGPTSSGGEAFDGAVGDSAVGGGAVGGGAVGDDTLSVPVRWYPTNDAIDWASELNFDNPLAASDFAGTLRELEPDIVHFHSMQGLGAGLLGEAERHGVPFVVTAHDFWWWCGRQFLCDREYHPCSPVVVAGVCPCMVDRGWLDGRTRFTTSALAVSARVVAVSETSAAVLRANGVPPDRVVVVDNPVERAEAATGVSASGATSGSAALAAQGAGRSRRDAGEPVRFVFAGGSDPMKGLPVLLAALGSLDGVGGWTLDLYGMVDGATPPDQALPSNVRAHPPFAPHDLTRVLSDADVLVLPSVMQETYSILTREALAMGVPVLTTACLGPEEVVTDRVNGLVVPQDDPGALGGAMAELSRDRSLLERLTRAARGAKLTGVGEHCDRLEALYAELVPTWRSPGSARIAGERDEGVRLVPSDRPRARRVERVLFVVGIEGAPLRYRAHLPAEALGLLGVHADVRHYRHPDIVGLAEKADVVVVYRVPATFQIERFVADVHARDKPVLFDVDDLIFDPDLEGEIPALEILSGADRDLWIQGVHRYRTTMELCDAYVGSTQQLCDHAAAVTGLRTFRFPNGAGVVMSRLADAAIRGGRAAGPVRVGYLSGTDTHDHDWAMIEEAVVAEIEKVTDAELWLVGQLTPGDAARRLGDRLRLVPFQPWTRLPELLGTLDVNLAPLEPDSRFNDAKSAIKWLEAALSGTPTIATPTRPFQEVVEDGVNGVLADGDAQWASALALLMSDGAMRRRIGRRARRDALVRLGPWTQGRRYLEILESVEMRSAHDSAWRPVLLDEPFEPITLEPYGEPVPLPVPRAPDPRTRVGALARRGVASVRRRGVRKTSLVVLARLGHKSRQWVRRA